MEKIQLPVKNSKLVMGGWTKEYIFLISITVVVSTALVSLLFSSNLVHTFFIVGGIAVALTYFMLVRSIFLHWLPLPDLVFIRRLFITALITRIGFSILLYYFYQWQTGEPFEYNAVDSKFYHLTGMMVADHFRNMDFNIAGYLSDMGFSDKGYNIYLGMVYTIFGKSILAARIINSLFGAVTVVMLYQLTRISTTNEYTSRLAAIMALLLPNFLLYLGTHLKETLMVFMVVTALYLSVRVFKINRHRIISIIMLLSLFFILFMFRTVLGVTVVGSFAFYGFVNNKSSGKILNRLATIALIAGFLYIVFLSPVGTEIGEYLEKYSTNQSDNMEFRATREGGNKYALLAGAPLFLSIILIAPFPSMVYVPEQDLLWMFIGANFIRNLLGLFILAGIFYLAKKYFRQSAVLIAFLTGYLLVLANSGFAISERFHLPVVPVLLIFTAAGLTRYAASLRKYYPWYLLLITVFIIGWNYIKLSGRG